MSDVGQSERAAQNRVVRLLRDRLGYRYLGDWQRRPGNANVEVEFLAANLRKRGYSEALITRAVRELKQAAALGGSRDLYEANRDVYGLLRYGVKVQESAGSPHVTVHLIDWANLDANDFAFAQEVTVTGPQHAKRPDVVLYVNGIALVTLELKRSTVAVGEGIRQTIGNQKPEYIRQFFTTVQLVLAGNDSEGLSYGVIDTPEKYWLRWRLITDMDPATRARVTAEAAVAEGRLDQGLAVLVARHRLLEMIHDFIVFDAGVKKTARPNQYFGVRAAQERMRRREGGIIWHTQGSGKSLTMVWLAKWLTEQDPAARVLLMTDRTELDEQIERVFTGVREDIYRTSSGADLLAVLDGSTERLICSLIHKFRAPGSSSGSSSRELSDDEATARFIEELRRSVPPGFAAKGNLYVFVDEAHRTQAGKMHAAMKALLPNAVFIGFTGTPLLKADKKTTFEQFGSFIHAYKFDEGVQDGVILDLRYEARNIEQHLSSPGKIDQWFDAKTRGMTNLAKAALKKRWGTFQKVASSRSRTQQVVADILLDMETRPRLMDGRGNAMLVCDSIYQACMTYRAFVEAGFKGKCAIVTSYTPSASDASKDDGGQGMTEKLLQYNTYLEMLSDYFGEPPATAMHKAARFEQEVKARFIKEPGQMRVLIVVDKLLTGFDAPSATYLYIDKSMRDHGLFQAICRVNRLDGDDKDYGYIVDYQDLFRALRDAISDYTTGPLEGYDKQDVAGLLSDRLVKGREDLDEALDYVEAICEPVEPPKNTAQYLRHFCAAEAGNAAQLQANEFKRVDLYKGVARLVRAYANLANDMAGAGYSDARAAEIKARVTHFAAVRDEVRQGAGDKVDFKKYEPGMRHLLDSYIQADAPERVADLGDAGLIDLIVKLGPAAVDHLPPGTRKDPDAVAETIANNVRRLIIDETPTNPRYYERMSELLADLIRQRHEQAVSYKEYLERLIELARQAGTGQGGTYPGWADTGAKRALLDFGLPEADAIAVDRCVLDARLDQWVGSLMKERKLKNALRQTLGDSFGRLDELFELIKARDEYH